MTPTDIRARELLEKCEPAGLANLVAVSEAALITSKSLLAMVGMQVDGDGDPIEKETAAAWARDSAEVDAALALIGCAAKGDQ